ncbi:AraC family transcriptional regulator [Clostridium sp. P21]|uniref:AraC family transcriptional regulator n=1 Tax=Clostridium muellerianum TaxID=2716538 RepID=A0A7Y0HQY7_9CLOT|nr:AraC family transcriptional regulator [Clostridium muellerianum]NMM64293.1 AraC family transcriptional regulator [Clostridium muellerianum]
MLDLYYKDIKKHIHFMHIPVKFRYTEFHLHNYFEIYFFINGNAKYFIEKKVYSLNHGDLLITNNNEIHKSVVVPGEIYDVISMQVNPSLIKILSSPKYNLLNCFINRPHGENNKIFFEEKQLKKVIDIFKKIEDTYTSEVLGFEILLTAYLMELLMIINNNFDENIQNKEISTTPDMLTPILEYIDFNLNSNLSLETLENKFNINRFYLSRLFKKTFGSTLHEYILFKRLSMAKRLLQTGKNVTEACELSGFNDYFHFIRIFKKYVGTPPGKFKKNSIHKF